MPGVGIEPIAGNESNSSKRGVARFLADLKMMLRASSFVQVKVETRILATL